MSHIISPAILDQFHKLIDERTGLSAYRQSSAALEELILNHSNGDPKSYLSALYQARITDQTWQDLIDAFTIGETYFLRDKVHFQLLREHIFPGLFQARRLKRHLSIWSVGCATGEEPYSLAITLHEILPEISSWTIDILGTDLNENALKTARRGVYRKWAFRHTNLDFQQTYFDPVAGGLQIKPEIRQMVRFRQANLLSPLSSATFDLILCRNVLIYFSAASVQRAETIITEAAASDGWLLLGHSEGLRFEQKTWTQGQFPSLPVYQRAAAPSIVKPRVVPHSIRKTLTSELPALTLVSDNSIKARYRNAVRAIHQEDVQQAEKLAIAITEDEPNHAKAHTLLASIHADRGEQPTAHKHLDAALYGNPLIADAHYLRALLFIEAERHGEAHRALVAALYCQQHHPLASYMMGNLCARSGDLRRATHYWQNTLRALRNLADSEPISDISQLTVGQLSKLVSEQLAGWE